MGPTLYRELPGYSVQLGSYEYLKKKIQFKEPSHIKDTFKTIMCGGISGILCWLVSYPQDVIKSKIQIGDIKLSGNKFKKNYYNIIKNEGYIGLWKGFSPCLLRAFPANAAIFLGYEYTINLLK